MTDHRSGHSARVDGARLKLAIWGASGHALVVADAVRQGSTFEIAGFLDDVDPSRAGSPFAGSTVWGGRECLATMRDQGISHLIVAVGDCAARMRIADSVREAGFLLANAVHPRAVVAPDVRVGPGSVVVAGAVVGPGCFVGENVIVNTAAAVDHECTLGNGSHVGPGARLGGRVQVGVGAWIGIGAIVRDRVRIGAGSTVGAGSLVLSDVPEQVIAYGAPAEVVRSATPQP